MLCVLSAMTSWPSKSCIPLEVFRRGDFTDIVEETYDSLTMSHRNAETRHNDDVGAFSWPDIGL